MISPAIAIRQGLVETCDTCGFTGSYQSVLRFVRKLYPITRRKRVRSIETAPGEECQVDYGTGPMVRDPATGKYRRTRLFVMTLGYSRKSVRLLVFRSSSQIWAELHKKAFRRLTDSIVASPITVRECVHSGPAIGKGNHRAQWVQDVGGQDDIALFCQNLLSGSRLFHSLPRTRYQFDRPVSCHHHCE